MDFTLNGRRLYRFCLSEDQLRYPSLVSGIGCLDSFIFSDVIELVLSAALDEMTFCCSVKRLSNTNMVISLLALEQWYTFHMRLGILQGSH